VTRTGAINETLVVAALPLSDTLTVAVRSEGMLPAFTGNAVETAPAATVHEAGTVSSVEVDTIVTVLPPVGAGLDKLTVQVLVEFCFSADGAHWTAVTRTGATSDTVAAAELPFKAAVIVATLSEAIVAVLTLNAAVVAPTTGLADTGTLTNDPEDASATVLPARAGFDSVIVQLPVVFGPRLEGTHRSEVTHTGATSDRPALTAVPPAVAVTWATPSAAIVPAVAANVAVIDPAAAVTDAGTVTSGLSDATVSTTPPAGAVCDSVIVQLPAALLASAFGEHCRALGIVGGIGAVEMLVFVDEPFNATPMVAVAGLDPTATLAVKLAELAPVGTVTSPGTVTLAPLDVTVTPAPPAGAAYVNKIVHVLDPDTLNTVGAQVSPVTVTKVGGVGFTGVIGTALPLRSAPIAALSATEPAVVGTLKVATVPAAITSGPRPYATHA